MASQTGVLAAVVGYTAALVVVVVVVVVVWAVRRVHSIVAGRATHRQSNNQKITV